MLEASRGQTDELRRMQRELFDAVGRFRWRLGGERLLVFAWRGAIGAALLVAGIRLVAWAMDLPLGAWAWEVAGLAPLVAIGLALARWPSSVQAARAADHHLALAERLATAVEQGRVDLGDLGRRARRVLEKTARPPEPEQLF
jgi:hypothetical protein